MVGTDLQSKTRGESEVGEAERGLVIERRFTSHDSPVWEQFDWFIDDIEIRNPDGSLAHEIKGVEFPEGFRGVPAMVAAQKYLRRVVPGMDHLEKIPEDDVPEWLWRNAPNMKMRKDMSEEEWVGRETSGKQLFHRLAGCWTYWGWKNDYFVSEVDARAYYDEMCYLLASQCSAPNSPQWFNTGLNWAYGIEGPAQGHWYVNPLTDEDTLSKNAYERPQPHACFIQSIEDKLVGPDSITDLISREALLFKFGSGTGSNFSNLRAAGEPLSGGGQSSGLLSFLMILDKAAGAIKSGGTTRRAAKMVTLNLDHPDIREYVNWKMKEEEKVSALIIGAAALQKHANGILAAVNDWDGDAADKLDTRRNQQLARAISQAMNANIPPPHIKRILDLADQGWESVTFQNFDSDWQGAGYLTVSGQNSNNSVRADNEFMHAVESGGEWNLYWRTELEKAKEEGRDPVPNETMPAVDLWDDIAYAAWACADPGIQFDTTINDWHTCPNSGRINGSNPCSEYMFLDDTACNLASLNLLKFHDMDQGKFNIDDYVHSIRLWTITLELSVVMAQFPSKKISRLSYETRTLGLGFCNLGSLLMHMGIPYDDPRGYSICGALAAIMTGQSYRTSAEMASFLGPFEQYEDNREPMMRVMRNHMRAAYDAPINEYEGLSVLPVAIDPKKCTKDLHEAACAAWEAAVRKGEEHGYRNAQTTVIAPTGTIGLVMGADTTGVEPQYSLVQFKDLAGGGMLKIPMTGMPAGLRKQGYSKVAVERIMDYVLGTSSLVDCPVISQGTLMDLGFTEAELSKLDDAIPKVLGIRGLFSPEIVGIDFCKEVLELDEAQMDAPTFDLLTHLRFSRAEVQLAEDHIFGRLTIEGAPGLKEEHLAVFDCAQPCGRIGKRSIPWKAHVDMMAAAQPFISGAISKTINMPADVTIDDVKNAYVRSWETGNKACALYRDGSKLSQPLTSALVDNSVLVENDSDMMTEPLEMAPLQKMVDQAVEQLPLAPAEARPVAEALVHNYVAVRRALPDERNSHTLKARLGGHTVYLTSSAYQDEKLGEIMITTSKEGAAWRSLLNQFAIAVSIGLQYGVPLEAFVKSFTWQKFEPSGIVQGGSNRVKMATSIVDYIFRELAIKYLGKDDLANVSAEDLEYTSISRPEETPDGLMRVAGEKRDIQMTLDFPTDIDEEMERVRISRERGFTGDICQNCGQSQMTRNGTCLKCNACGETTGCS